MGRSCFAVLFGVGLIALVEPRGVEAEVPYPSPPAGVSAHRFEEYCFIPHGGDLPMNYAGDDVWKYTSEQSGNPVVDNDPRELYGVMGMRVDQAWQITTGRPDVVIAVVDSGIEWDDPSIREINNKFYLNRGELPPPRGSPGNAYDSNQDGVFNIEDYADDPRVADWNGNGIKDPQDLIHTFSDGVDADRNGYVDDICGWDMVDDDNDPYDDVHYGHGTGESKDSCGEAFTDRYDGFPGTCPNCMILPVRVGLSFIAEDTTFGRAVIFAVDSGADVVQEALGTVNGSRFSQEAIDYAYRRGVPIIASAADESSIHANLPAAHEHTITVNSVTRFEPGMEPESYLYLNGCTNYGGRIDAAVSSTSCSSEAVGRGAGIAGLVISAAKNELARGGLDRALTANEVKQILTMSAEDIDFTGHYAVSFPVFKTRRFRSGPGWDAYFGYGRVNALEAVRMVVDHEIPPEADVVYPRWFETLDPARTPEVEIRGMAAASRTGSYTYRVEFGRGLQPGPSDWQTLFESGTLSGPVEGRLCSWDIHRFQEEISRPPEDHRDLTFTIRLVVTDDAGRRGESRKTIYLHHDPDLKVGYPLRFGSSGEASVVMADIDGDNVEEMVVATSDGMVRVLNEDGGLVDGWPATTDLLAHRYTGSEAYQSGAVGQDMHESIGYGGVAVGDLDRDGSPEVVAASLFGKVYAWEHDGTLRHGFPVSLGPAFSLNPRFLSESSTGRDRFNRRLSGVSGSPVLEDLDGDGRLEIICAALDNHVYVWDASGRRVPGWPVLVIDPSRFHVADEVTHRIAPLPSGCPECGYYTGKIISTPAVGDINGDGYPEIVVGTNEQYDEPMNVSLSAGLLGIVGKYGLMGGNGRLHALYHDGMNHEGGPFVTGWPARLGLLMPELLPYLGSGVPGSPALADVDGDGVAEIAASSAVGPMYLLTGAGSSFYGTDGDGDYHVMDTGPFRRPGSDLPTIPAMGSPLFADLAGNGRLACIAPSAGLRKLADIQLPAEQVGNQNHISAWDARRGRMLAGFPVFMDDLQFIEGPSVGDVDGDGRIEVIGGSGGFLVRAYGPDGRVPAGWPKFTGRWVISTPSTGDIDGDGLVEVAVMTRDGDLYVWDTAGDACEPCNGQWRTFHHDGQRTGLYGRDTVPPDRPLDFQAVRQGDRLHLSWTATGDDGPCGRAWRYVIRGYQGDVEANWERARRVAVWEGAELAGEHVEMTIEDPGFRFYGIQVEDDAGNPARVVSFEAIEMPETGPGTPPPRKEEDDSDLWLVSTVRSPAGGGEGGDAFSGVVNVLAFLILPAGLVLFWRRRRCRGSSTGASSFGSEGRGRRRLAMGMAGRAGNSFQRGGAGTT